MVYLVKGYSNIEAVRLPAKVVICSSGGDALSTSYLLHILTPEAMRVITYE